jgi:hypothetical protein
MSRLAVALSALVMLVPFASAQAQVLTARRTAMGGVILPGGGQGSEGANVAYRAVPKRPGASVGFPLPIGLIPVIANPPTLDPDDPEFNIYELADLLYNPPWNLQLVSPEPPSSDIVVELGKNHLAVELGEVAALFPDDHSRLVGLVPGPNLGFGFRNFFVSASALAHYENDLRLNPALHAALSEGAPFQTNTEYALYDNVGGKAAATLQLGWAGGVLGSRDPESGSTLYAGVRARMMRGLAYADAQNTAAFTTDSVLFSSTPINLEYRSDIRQAGPDGGRWGQGFVLGLAWVSGSLELGVGLNNLGARIDWRVEESVAHRDSATGDLVRDVIREDVPFTSELPLTGTANAALRLGNTTIAADVVRSMGDVTGHLGAEHWLGPMALRSGAGLDANRQLQAAGGVGFRLGRFGLDFAVASHSRSLTQERGVELGAGLSLYR